MDEYIKRKDVLTALDYVGFAPDTDPVPLTLATARKHVRRIPSADVVSRAELDKLEYTLLGVMHSVDKWLEGDELEQDEVNRAITMREKTLRIIETLKSEIEREIGEEIYRIIGECHNETWVCLLIKEFADRLINGNKSNVETCIACGDVIPEGRWICPNCEEETK